MVSFGSSVRCDTQLSKALMSRKAPNHMDGSHQGPSVRTLRPDQSPRLLGMYTGSVWIAARAGRYRNLRRARVHRRLPTVHRDVEGAGMAAEFGVRLQQHDVVHAVEQPGQ